MWEGVGENHADAGKTYKQRAERSQAWEHKPTTFDNTGNCATILASQVTGVFGKQPVPLLTSLVHDQHMFCNKGPLCSFFKCFVVFCHGQGDCESLAAVS